MKRLKVLLFPLSSFISHATRCLCIADELAKRGHQVEFASSAANRELIIKAGYPSHLVKQLCHEQIIVTGAPKSYLDRYQQNTQNCRHNDKFGLKEMASQDLAVLNKVKPDIVICDASPTSYLAATVLGIPCVMVKNILGYIDSNLSKHAIKSGLNLTDELDFTLENKMSKEFHSDCVKLNKAFVETYKTIPFIIPGVPEFEKINNVNIFQNMSHCFVGNLEWQGWAKSSKPDLTKYRNKTVILVTFGSSFPFESLIINILSAFKDDPYHIIINTGNQFNCPEIQQYQTNFDIYPYLSLNDFLEIADIIVCHGGHGTIMSALKTGAPSVVIPFNGDQMVISKQIEELKCGIRIKKYPDDITPDKLYYAINKVLNDQTYKLNTIKYGNILKQKGNGASNAVDFIEDFYSLRKWDDKVSQEFLDLVSHRKQKQLKKDVKILFAPNYHRWHIVLSCLDIAEELRNNGCDVGFIISAQHKLHIEKSGFNAFVSDLLSSEFITAIDVHDGYFNNFINENPLNTLQSSHNLEKMIHDDLNIFHQFKPDIVIDAGRMSIEISSKHFEIPSIKLYTFNNSSIPRLTKHRDVNNANNSKLLMTIHKSLEDLKGKYPPSPKLTITNKYNPGIPEPILAPTVPSIKINILDAGRNQQSIAHMGCLGLKNEKNDLIKPKSIYFDTIVILVILTDLVIYKNVIRQMREFYGSSKFKVIIVYDKSMERFLSDVDYKNDNIELIENPSIPEFLKVSDIVIHNGNYENTLLALKNRIPSLAIPYYEDEFYFSEKLFENNWGKLIKVFPLNITSEIISNNINATLNAKEQMRDNMNKVSGELSIWDNGAKRAAYIIEDFHRQSLNNRLNLHDAV